MRVAAWIAFAAVAACHSARPTLLACWRDATGGANVRAVERHGQIRMGDLGGPIASTIRFDGATRDEYALGAERSVQVFDGVHAWARDGRGAPRELSGAELSGAIADAYADTLAPLRPGGLAGTVEPGPTPDVLILRPRGGDPVTVTFDRATCLPLTRSRPLDDHAWTATFSGWRSFAGLTLPTTIRFTGGIEVTYTETRVDPPLSPAAFARPAPLAPPFPAGVHTIELPLRVVDNTPMIAARISDRGPLWMILDTGADVSHVDRARAAALGLAASGTTSAAGATGAVTAQQIAAPVVALGPLVVPLDVMSATPLDNIPGVDGASLEGILGHDVLGAFVVEVDYRAERVRLHDPATYAPPAGAIVLPMTFYGGKPLVTATAELADGTRLDLRLVIDTGSSLPLLVRHPVVVAHDLAARIAPGPPVETGTGIGGATHGTRGRIAALHLGALALRNTAVVLSADTSGAHASGEIDGSLGGALLRDLTLVVDYAHMRVLLVAPSD